jgi:regulation of enolase protein 1 (concanavalin A-like superfamily)
MFERCQWLNEPVQWDLKADRLRVITDPETDFWRDTYYGFVHDSGHSYGIQTNGDFTAQAHVRGDFETLYDQAGLMIRVDERNWAKAGVELTDGVLTTSSVITLEQSDWALGSPMTAAGGFWLRATIERGVLRLQSSTDGVTWPLLRLAPFPESSSYFVGVVCCSPKRGGLAIDFSEFSVGQPQAKDLHDSS